jgi:hypothetical protein
MDDTSKRRAISTPIKDLKGPHPFGVRNRHLINARKALRNGRPDEARKEMVSAANIAPLTKLELSKLKGV